MFCLATLFNMATASNLFKTRKQLENLGATQIAANYIYEQQVYVPLYEGKCSGYIIITLVNFLMIHQPTNILTPYQRLTSQYLKTRTLVYLHGIG